MRDHEKAQKIVRCLDDDFLIQYFKIDQFEKLALYNYGSPGKHDPTLDVYMGPHSRWGGYGNGWAALNSALRKLPSFEALGLENLPLFRVEREGSKLFTTLSNSGPTYVFHGMRVMKFGQYHILSTSLMPSAGHNALKNNYSKGLFIYYSKTARYFNNFSIQGMVDGGETLILPGAITLFKGIEKTYWMGELVDCAVLEEVGTVNELKGKKRLKSGIKCIDDHELSDITNWVKNEDFVEGYDGWNKYKHLTGINFTLDGVDDSVLKSSLK